MQIETLKKVNGKIVVSKSDRYRPTNKEPNYNSKFAKKRISQELANMNYEVQKSFKEGSGHYNNQRWADSNTFPSYMKKAGINSRSDFDKVMKSSKGVRFNRLKSEAIDRLNKGYQNSHGFDMPDIKFKVKTGQLYDNKDIIFRRVKGRIIPMRVSKNNRYDLMDDAPF